MFPFLFILISHKNYFETFPIANSDVGNDIENDIQRHRKRYRERYRKRYK